MKELNSIIMLVTAIVSTLTAVLLWPLLPKALRIPTPTELEAKNEELRNEIKRRKEVENQLLDIKKQLEIKVMERTEELQSTNTMLLQALKEQELAQSELLKAMKIAEEANKAKTSFLANMSHELRTPLNSILGFAQIMEQEKQILEPRHQKGTTKILQSGRQLLRLINEILDITKVESGYINLEMKEISPWEVVGNSIKTVEQYANEKNIHIDLQSQQPAADYLIYADSSRLGQVMTNLLTNAIKYNHPGGRILIEFEVHSSELQIRIIDNGFGISKEELQSVFKPFYRSKDNSHIEGSGIGLALVKQLVEAMNGRVAVESNLGKGSIFSISFPVVQSK